MSNSKVTVEELLEKKRTELRLRELRTTIGCSGMCYGCTDFYVGSAGLGCKARSRYGELKDG